MYIYIYIHMSTTNANINGEAATAAKYSVKFSDMSFPEITPANSVVLHSNVYMIASTYSILRVISG